MMKNIVLLITILFGCQIHAQNYLPMLTNGKVWHCVEHDDEITEYRYTISICGDTLVNGRACKIMRYEYKDGEENPYKVNKIWKSIAWEEAGAVYYTYWDGEANEYVDIQICDFNLSPGAKAWYGRITKVDTIEVHGTQRRRLTIDNDELSIWVEGIGVSSDLWPTNGGISHGEYSCIESCYENGKLIFSQEDFLAPAISTGIGDITTTAERNVETYDLCGRKLKEPKQKGIIIQDGRKYFRR